MATSRLVRPSATSSVTECSASVRLSHPNVGRRDPVEQADRRVDWASFVGMKQTRAPATLPPSSIASRETLSALPSAKVNRCLIWPAPLS